jgi:hypothetical protein
VKKIKSEEHHLTREQDRCHAILALQRTNDIMTLLLEGKESKEINNYIVQKYSCSHASATVYMSHARKALANRKNFEVDNMINIHIERYEHIYGKLYDLRAFMEATNSLKRKERLLGFHKEGFHMKVTQGEITAISLQQVRDEFDVMKLSEEKRNRMSQLLSKAKESQKKLKVG